MSGSGTRKTKGRGKSRYRFTIFPSAGLKIFNSNHVLWGPFSGPLITPMRKQHAAVERCLHHNSAWKPQNHKISFVKSLKVTMFHLLPKAGLTSEAEKVLHDLFCLNISAIENPTIINSTGLAIHLHIHLSVMSLNHLYWWAATNMSWVTNSSWRHPGDTDTQIATLGSKSKYRESRVSREG